MRTLRWLTLILVLMAVYAMHASGAGTGMSPAALLDSIAIQAVALAAVLARWRRARGEARQLWLLLVWAMVLPTLCSVFYLISGQASGEATLLLGVVATVLSGLYMLPCMFMIARSFSRDTPPMVRVLDGLIAACATVLLSVLIYTVAVMPPAKGETYVQALAFLIDAVNYTLAILATVRLAGVTTRMRRHAYFVAAVFLWINALALSAFNRLQLHGTPWWSWGLLDAGFVAAMLVSLRPVPRWLRRLRPSRRAASIVDGFAPIVLSVIVLSLGISMSRLNFGFGMIVSVVSVLLYGLRMAYIQTRERDRQRLAARSNRLLRRQAGTDSLTGIANRATLDTRLQQMLQGRRRGTSMFAVLMIDVDYFKQYNDTFGHIAGDTCLVRIVDALRTNLLRSGDLVARYGGEEFAIVLPVTNADNARRVAQRLVDAVANLEIPHPASPYGRVTVSAGVALCSAFEDGDAVTLLNAADKALYRAKCKGRNRSEVAQTLQGEPALEPAST